MYTRFRDGRTDRYIRVFQYTHHSASGGIINLKKEQSWKNNFLKKYGFC